MDWSRWFNARNAFELQWRSVQPHAIAPLRRRYKYNGGLSRGMDGDLYWCITSSRTIRAAGSIELLSNHVANEEATIKRNQMFCCWFELLTARTEILTELETKLWWYILGNSITVWLLTIFSFWSRVGGVGAVRCIIRALHFCLPIIATFKMRDTLSLI